VRPLQFTSFILSDIQSVLVTRSHVVKIGGHQALVWAARLHQNLEGRLKQTLVFFGQIRQDRWLNVPTGLQVADKPLANTERYDSLRGQASTEEVDHA
jgi:hypothetical protein